MSARAPRGLHEQLRMEVDIPRPRCKAWPVLVAVCLLHQLPCSAQERTLSFTSRNDSLKEWSCPLPVEVTIQTKDKKKIQCAIIGADGSGFIALEFISDTALERSIEWRKAYAEWWHYRNVIESDPSLPDEEQRKLILQKAIGVIYRDTIRPELVEIKKITFHYSPASRLEKTAALGTYIGAGCVFMVGMIELLTANDPEIEDHMEAPYPAMLLAGGLAGLTASGSWVFHTNHKVIRPSAWQLRGQ